MHYLIANLRAVVDSRAPDSVLLGEFYLPIDELVTFYGRERPELHLPVNLTLTYTDWNAGAVAKVLAEYQKAVPENAWPTTSIGTHDQPRIAMRTEGAQPRVAAMLLFTQRGTPTLYYGDEVGMRGVPIPQESARDPQGRRTGRNRDPERTPMQWSAQLHAGFSSVEPWLPIADDFRTACVAAQSDDPKSLLSLCRRLIELRKREPLLVDGAQEPLERDPPIVGYRRASAGRTFYVLLNLGHEPRSCAIERGRSGRVLLSTFLDRDGERTGDAIELRGDEGAIVVLD
jgi:alpha-glucosidase